MLAVVVAVEEDHEAGGHRPVTSQIHVLQGVHGDILEHRQIDQLGEEVQSDQVPPQSASVGFGLEVGKTTVGRVGGDALYGAVDEGVEFLAAVEPEHKELKYLGGLGW